MPEALAATSRPAPGPDRVGASDPAPGSTLPALGLAVWFALVALWLTWIPFAVRPSPDPLRWPSDASPVDLLGNLLLLAPFGVAVGLVAERRPVVTALAAAASLSLVMELGQLFLVSRITSPADLVLNAMGGGGAAALVVRGRRWIGRDQILGGVVVLIFLGLAGQFAFGVHAVRETMRITGWDPGFEIVAGDEVGGGRGYDGEVLGAHICAGAGAERVCATSGADSVLRERLVRVAERSQRVVVEARILSASDVQRGPARILTFSGGLDRQNVMLGQEGTALILRVLTPRVHVREYDSGPELRLPEAVHAGETATVSAVFDGGQVRIESRSDRGRTSGTFAYSALTRSILSRPNLRADPEHFLGAAIAGAVVLCLPLGLFLGWRFPRRPRLALLLAAIASTATVHLLHSPPGILSDPFLALAALGATAAGVGRGRRRPVCALPLRTSPAREP